MNSAQFLADAQALCAERAALRGRRRQPAGHAVHGGASTGDAEAALARPGTKVLEATYTLPYVSHACMEVLNCTVDYVPGVRCDVYAPTQAAESALCAGGGAHRPAEPTR